MDKGMIVAAYGSGADMIVIPCPLYQMNTEVSQDEINVKHGIKFNMPVVY